MRLEAERTRIRRVLRQRAFAAGFLVAGVLVFTWPFVRAPRPDPCARSRTSLGAWLLVVIGLSAMARALARGERPAGGPEDERRG